MNNREYCKDRVSDLRQGFVTFSDFLINFSERIVQNKQPIPFNIED